MFTWTNFQKNLLKIQEVIPISAFNSQRQLHLNDILLLFKLNQKAM